MGESRISLSGLGVALRLVFADGGADYAFTCSQPSSVGIGECQSTVPSSQFGSMLRSAQANLAASYGSSPVASASGGAVSLQPVVTPGTLTSAGVLASLPRSPRYVGDQFSVRISAHTGAAAVALKAWGLRLRYNTSNLVLVGTPTFSAVYQTPTYVHNAQQGTFDVITTGTQASYPDSTVTAKTSLYLMTMQFRVVSGAGSTSLPAFEGTVDQMVNQNTQDYVSNVPVQVTDHRGSLFNSSSLVIEATSVVGVLAYLETASQVNTAALNGTVISSQVLRWGLNPRAAPSASPRALHCLPRHLRSLLASSPTVAGQRAAAVQPCLNVVVTQLGVHVRVVGYIHCQRAWRFVHHRAQGDAH
jgi:hypothetical protein